MGGFIWIKDESEWKALEKKASSEGIDVWQLVGRAIDDLLAESKRKQHHRSGLVTEKEDE